MDNIHTKHHNKDPNTNRSVEIEGYIEQSFNYGLEILKSVNSDIASNNQSKEFFDIGCDYGFAMHLAEKQGFKSSGIDLMPYSVGLSNGPMTACDLNKDESVFESISQGQFDYIFINHVLEHLEKPHDLMRQVKRILNPNGVVMIALPHCDYDWAYWDGHVSIWNERWLETFMSQHKLKPVITGQKNSIITTCLRPNISNYNDSKLQVEIWGTFVHA